MHVALPKKGGRGVLLERSPRAAGLPPHTPSGSAAGVKRAGAPGVLDAGPCLLSDLQRLPPAQRHGQQKDPSPPEGIDLHGKLGTAETPQALYPPLGPRR